MQYMQYKNTYKNGNLCIKIHTNSKRFYKLIDNHLDFNNTYRLKPKIKVDFYLEEINLKDADDNEMFFSQSNLDGNKNLLSSFGNKIATVTANHKTGVVKGTILNYQESCKECIWDFIFARPLRFILAHYDLFFLHASVVCKDKNCILLVGPQNSGKSTLALILAQNGFNLLADDDCFVRLVRKQIQLFPFPTKMGLNDEILKKYPELNKHTLKNYRYGGKRRLSLSPIYNTGGTKAYRCRMIIFPKYKPSENVRMRKISNKKTLIRLAKANLNEYLIRELRTIKIFWTLYSLTKKAKSFELIYNDDRLNEIAKIVNKNF